MQSYHRRLMVAPAHMRFALQSGFPRIKVRLSVLCEAGIPPSLGEPLSLPF